ncbi:uncharacterized protein [Montipora foliosa]|uniref:uncharacterized protein n=1 Tax=Montipora foliosa TaxID=591990 RepID=UPI0035F1FDC1
MPCQVDEDVQDRGSRPLAVLEKACMMQGQASAEINIVDEIATNDSMHWQMNLQVKQDQQNDEECLPKGTELDQWFENQALSEAVSSVNVDQMDAQNPSIQEILEASRLNKNKDILQLLDEIGSGNSAVLGGHYWQDVGCNEFATESTESFSVGEAEECHHFSDCQPFRPFVEPLPLVVPPIPVSSCSLGQPGDGSIWAGQSSTDSLRGLAVECIQAGEAFSLGQSNQEIRELNDEIKKQEEKKRKRRERNKQCSREFRRKQKVREQLLTRGKAEKEQLLVERHKRMEKTTKILTKIANSSGACEKGRAIINMVANLINKENLPRAKGTCNLAPASSYTKTQGV